MADATQVPDALQVPKLRNARASISSDTSGKASQLSGSSGKASVASTSSNPLAPVSQEQLLEDAENFAKTHGLLEYVDVIKKGALVAQDPTLFESLPMLTDEDRRVLRREITHKWDQPAMLYYLVVMCSVAAAVQGVCLPYYLCP